MKKTPDFSAAFDALQSCNDNLSVPSSIYDQWPSALKKKYLRFLRDLAAKQEAVQKLQTKFETYSQQTAEGQDS